jgi:hypothetical protein
MKRNPTKMHTEKIRTPMPTLGDLINAITSTLTSGLNSNYCAAGSVQAANPPPPTVNQSESLSTASLADVQNAVTYAVQSKWHTEVGPGSNLKIKGAEMVKRITGLEVSEPD